MSGDRWWEAPAEERHGIVQQTTDYLWEQDAPRRSRYQRLLSLYASRPISGLGAEDYDRRDERQEAIRLNIARNMVDAITAKIAKNRPAAMCITEGGDFGMQQSAKRIEKFVRGNFYLNKFHERLPVWFRDAAIFNCGVAKVCGEGERGKPGRITIERVYPWELLVDPVDAFYGAPRSIFQRLAIPRAVLLRAYPKLASAIRSARPADGSMPGRDRLADQVAVNEGYHLPSGPGADDGLHVIAIDGAELYSEQWTSESSPYALLPWSDAVIGLWGESLIEEIEGVQREINELAYKTQRSMYHYSVPWLVQRDAGRDPSIRFDNDLRGVVVTVAPGEEAPQVVTHNTVAPEIFAHLDRLFARAYDLAGISQMYAQARLPAGLESGKAQLVYDDIQSERFVLRGRSLEAFVLDVAHLVIAEAGRLSERGVEIEVTSTDRRRRRSMLSRVSWSEIDLEASGYELKIVAASSLPQSLPGKIQSVDALVQAGMLSQQEGMALLDFPDLESSLNRELAPYEIVLDMLEAMIDDGEYVSPEPFMDLDLALRIVNHAYLRAKIERVPEERLDLLRRWQSVAEAMRRPMQMPTQPEPQPSTGMPPTGGGVPAAATPTPTNPAPPAPAQAA